MDLMELLGGSHECDEVREIKSLADSIWRRNKWAQLSTLQRVRIELGAAAGEAVEHNIHLNPAGTLKFWLGDELFKGVTMEVFTDETRREAIRVTDGKEEFLVRDEGDGVNISGVKPLGEASLVDEDEIAEKRASRRVQ